MTLDNPSRITNPRETSILFGHEAAEAELLSAWSQGRFAHSLLIVGPRGIGKATLAYRLARFVLSGGGVANLMGKPGSLAIPEDEPVFRRIASNSHADLKIVECGYDRKRERRREEIVVSDVRELVSFFAMTAAEGDWRVAIIDAADEMNRNAANALLKTLEEPPAQGLVILVAHVPGRVPATLRSRCRRLSLQPLAPELVGKLIANQRPDIAADQRNSLGRLAEGSPGRALTLANSDGLALYQELFNLISGLPKVDMLAVHRLGDRLNRKEEGDTFNMIAYFLPHWLERMIKGSTASSFPSPIVSGETEVMMRLVQTNSLERWCEVWEKVRDLFSATNAVNLDRKQVLLNVFSTLQITSRA
jgi:DNA polymerase-3 subunit delta'